MAREKKKVLTAGCGCGILHKNNQAGCLHPHPSLSCQMGQYRFVNACFRRFRVGMDESASMLFCCPPCGRLVGSNGYGRCFTISKKDLLINEEIREKEVRVVDADGSQLGIMPTRQALALAIDKGLDLVDIAPQATPNVCRIMDFGKYRYEQAKREKEARKNQKVVEVKEVRMSMNIDTHDFETKANQAIKFLSGGDKVKVSVRFRGREMAHTDLGRALLERFKDACAEVSSLDKPAKMEGRSMVIFLLPKNAK